MYYSRRHQERVEARDMRDFIKSLRMLIKWQLILAIIIIGGFVIAAQADGAALRIGAL